MTQRADSVDRLVQETASRYLQPKLGFPFALTAVGGYGRRELFPHSDVDLIVLAPEESLTELKEPLSEFLRELWDAGLRVSQSVRTVAECSRLHDRNIELHVSLLDARQVYGDSEIYAQLSQALAEFYRRHEKRLLHELAELTRQRHAKFHATVYHLEPDVKEVPGGIRDIHLLHWFSLLTQDRGPIGEALASVGQAKGISIRRAHAPSRADGQRQQPADIRMARPGGRESAWRADGAGGLDAGLLPPRAAGFSG